MKIDNYIRHLELQRKGLKTKYNEMQNTGDTRIKVGLDPLFHKRMKTREQVKEINNKLDFLKNLREELIKNEVQDKKSR